MASKESGPYTSGGDRGGSSEGDFWPPAPKGETAWGGRDAWFSSAKPHWSRPRQEVSHRASKDQKSLSDGWDQVSGVSRQDLSPLRPEVSRLAQNTDNAFPWGWGQDPDISKMDWHQYEQNKSLESTSTSIKEYSPEQGDWGGNPGWSLFPGLSYQQMNSVRALVNDTVPDLVAKQLDAAQDRHYQRTNEATPPGLSTCQTSSIVTPIIDAVNKEVSEKVEVALERVTLKAIEACTRAMITVSTTQAPPGSQQSTVSSPILTPVDVTTISSSFEPSVSSPPAPVQESKEVEVTRERYLEELGTFDPATDDVHYFTNRIRSLARSQGETPTCLGVPLQLRGLAESWYHLMLSDADRARLASSTEMWCDELLKKYQPSKPQALRELSRLSYGPADAEAKKNPETFAYSVLRYCRILGFSDKDCIDVISHQFDPEMSFNFQVACEGNDLKPLSSFMRCIENYRHIWFEKYSLNSEGRTPLRDGDNHLPNEARGQTYFDDLRPQISRSAVAHPTVRTRGRVQPPSKTQRPTWYNGMQPQMPPPNPSYGPVPHDAMFRNVYPSPTLRKLSFERVRPPPWNGWKPIVPHSAQDSHGGDVMTRTEGNKARRWQPADVRFVASTHTPPAMEDPYDGYGMNWAGCGNSDCSHTYCE
ncbi:MAG: hypothetical protein LQ351_005742 [Letrouitia transgressa]|nr:MAG: hypothetical protein LQ351_005742 [Letrouitia transgressa]